MVRCSLFLFLYCLPLFLFTSPSLSASPQYSFLSFVQSGETSYALSITDKDKTHYLPVCGCKSVVELKDLFSLPQDNSIEIKDSSFQLPDGVELDCLSPNTAKLWCSSYPEAKRPSLTAFYNYSRTFYVLAIGQDSFSLPLDCMGLKKHLPFKVSATLDDSDPLFVDAIPLSCGSELLKGVKGSLVTQSQALWKLFLYQSDEASFYIAVNEHPDKGRSFLPIFSINGNSLSRLESMGQLSTVETKLKKLFGTEQIKKILDLDEMGQRGEIIPKKLSESLFLDLNLSLKIEGPLRSFRLINKGEWPLSFSESDKEYLRTATIERWVSGLKKEWMLAIVQKDIPLLLFEDNLQFLVKLISLPKNLERNNQRLASFFEKRFNVVERAPYFYGHLIKTGVCEQIVKKGGELAPFMLEKSSNLTLNSCRPFDHVLHIKLEGDAYLFRSLRLSSQLGFDEVIISSLSSSEKAHLHINFSRYQLGGYDGAIFAQDIPSLKIKNIDFSMEEGTSSFVSYLYLLKTSFKGENLIFHNAEGKLGTSNNIEAFDNSIVLLDKSNLSAKKSNLFLDNSLAYITEGDMKATEGISFVGNNNASLFLKDTTLHLSQGAMNLSHSSRAVCSESHFVSDTSYKKYLPCFKLEDRSSAFLIACQTGFVSVDCQFMNGNNCNYVSLDSESSAIQKYDGHGQFIINGKSF